MEIIFLKYSTTTLKYNKNAVQGVGAPARRKEEIYRKI